MREKIRPRRFVRDPKGDIFLLLGDKKIKLSNALKDVLKKILKKEVRTNKRTPIVSKPQMSSFFKNRVVKSQKKTKSGRNSRSFRDPKKDSMNIEGVSNLVNKLIEEKLRVKKEEEEKEKKEKKPKEEVVLKAIKNEAEAIRETNVELNKIAEQRRNQLENDIATLQVKLGSERENLNAERDLGLEISRRNKELREKNNEVELALKLSTGKYIENIKNREKIYEKLEENAAKEFLGNLKKNSISAPGDKIVIRTGSSKDYKLNPLGFMRKAAFVKAKKKSNYIEVDKKDYEEAFSDEEKVKKEYLPKIPPESLPQYEIAKKIRPTEEERTLLEKYGKLEEEKNEPIKLENEEEKPEENAGGESEGMYESEINEIMEGFPNYYGAIGIEELDETLKKICKEKPEIFSFIYLLKNDKEYRNGHWVAVFGDLENNMEIDYYNSFGFDADQEMKNKIKKVLEDGYNLNHFLKWKYNTVRMQLNSSKECGMFCCWILQQLYFGVPFKEATNYHDKEKNEKQMQKARINFGYI